ncbi:aldo/keto reductase [Kribbella sandramycini]|uniref:Aldo/keto reductase n=1 Tax=Kribbella sandramycini TaxID=60450 RepID=A0A7Y4NZI3_9ACTN|nr:aldo/keto reductase [Kribbella sandramycini]MBB6569986.1 aryl-alcohol dehydrogenase-like predicted oxidoreductase [Kribbella sandramycini]NOL40190.1 aldo/keto reductase [Kribbella sandramycini]
MALDNYYLLGRSGLRVSRLALGTMNFGTGGFHAPYGRTPEQAAAIFGAYVDAGGNFVDTADFYTAGESEQILGKLASGRRDRLVLTSKFTNSVGPGDPNAGGNGRKHMIRAAEDSLRRLGTDYLDLFLLHTWDRITPIEEVLRTFDDLTQAGKIRYAGLSDVPAWYAARAQTLGSVPLISLQLPYSLAERTIETEHVPMAQELGLGITAWSPLASGFLTGKYQRDDASGVTGDGRLSGEGSPARDWSDRHWALLDVVRSVADELGVTAAQVAVNWVATQPGIASAIVGASSPEQLTTTMAALDFELPAELRARLDTASAVPPESVYRMFTPDYQSWLVNAGAKVGDKPAGYRPPVLNWA